MNTLIPAIGSLVGLVSLKFYNLKDSEARLMAQCNAGEITREECDARLNG